MQHTSLAPHWQNSNANVEQLEQSWIMITLIESMIIH